MLADLHIHTKNSDGVDSLETIVKSMSDSEKVLLGVVDHHFLTLKNPLIYGKITVIPGIEVSGTSNGHSCHFTAYSLNPKTTLEMEQMLESIRDGYDARASKIVSNLRGRGYKLPKNVRDSTLPRPTYTYDIANKMKKILNMKTEKEVTEWAKINGNLFWIEEKDFLPDVKILTKILHDSNFKIFWAHPGTRFFKDTNTFNSAFGGILEAGIDGMECFFPSYSPNWFLKIAKSNNLTVSGGSDYHGIGRGIDAPFSCLPEEYTNEFMRLLTQTRNK